MRISDIKNKYKIKAVGYSIGFISLVWGIGSFFLGKYDDFTILNYVLISIILIIICIFLLIIDARNQEINRHIATIEDGTAGLLSVYDRLSNFEKREKYIRFFQQFVRYEKQVIGVQMYNYALSSLYLKNSIKLEYEGGYIDENCDINAIIQSYYTFKKRDLKILEKAIRQYKLMEDPEKLEEFFFNNLDKPDDGSKITDEYLALVSLAQEEIFKLWNIDPGKDPLTNLHGSKRYISKKRQGLAKAILSYEFFNMSTAYEFSYNGKSDVKSDRRYLSYIVESQTGEKKIYLIIYRVENHTDKHDIMELQQNVLNSFKELLSNNGLVEQKINLAEKNEGGLESLVKRIKKIY